MLGDAVHSTLSYAGITHERVAAWLGRPCNCEERQEKLNQLDAWARRVVAGHTTNAAKYLRAIISEQ